MHPRIKCTKDDWDFFTDSGRLCSATGNLSREQFEVVIRKQLRNYVSRNIAITGSMPINSSSMAVVLAGEVEGWKKAIGSEREPMEGCGCGVIK